MKEEEKEQLEKTSMDYRYQLLKKRARGLNDAMKLQTEESLHSLDVFVSTL